MKKWFKDILNDEKNKTGMLAAFITVVICFFVVTMFGINLFYPSILTGYCWTGITILSGLMFTGYSGRLD